MATKADLVRRTLKLLGKWEAGQEPAAEDVEAIEGYIPAKIAELRQRTIMDVPDIEKIDEAVLQWLAMLVAQDAAPEFGTGMDGTAITLAEQRLRQIYADSPTYSRQRGAYF